MPRSAPPARRRKYVDPPRRPSAAAPGPAIPEIFTSDPWTEEGRLARVGLRRQVLEGSGRRGWVARLLFAMSAGGVLALVILLVRDALGV